MGRTQRAHDLAHPCALAHADGHAVEVFANIGESAGVAAAVENGAEGIGPLAGNEIHARFETEKGIPVFFDFPIDCQFKILVIFDRA